MAAITRFDGFLLGANSGPEDYPCINDHIKLVNFPPPAVLAKNLSTKLFVDNYEMVRIWFVHEDKASIVTEAD